MTDVKQETRKRSELSDEEVRSGHWIALSNGLWQYEPRPLRLHRKRNKSEIRRDEYMKRVRKRQAEGVNF